MNCPSVVVGDGHLGIWGALAEVFPKAKEQRCWNHRIVNVLDKLPKSRQAEGKLPGNPEPPYKSASVSRERCRCLTGVQHPLGKRQSHRNLLRAATCQLGRNDLQQQHRWIPLRVMDLLVGHDHL